MTILKIPANVATSPQDGSTIRYTTTTGKFHDESDNVWFVHEMAATRHWNRIAKWLGENFREPLQEKNSET